MAPAGNKDIGIAAIDCGADAVYIAGPRFGAREAAGNSFEDIAALSAYAHRFGAKVYLTVNTILYDNETDAAGELITEGYRSGCDAVIIQDLGILRMPLPPVKLFASTQCNIRTPSQAVFLESLGFKRLILARELSLAQIREIRRSVKCEIESFVHGALCVSYSGQCYMSQYLCGRSANRGCCIQACRSAYDVVDGNGHTIIKNKAVLSLKDLSLENRMADLAEAGVTSFKIEGRLKNISYVKNVVRAYRNAVDSLVCSAPERFRNASYGRPEGGFTPDTSATFNRGYTEYFIDGKRGKWSSMDFSKSSGEKIGRVVSVIRNGASSTVFTYEKEAQCSPVGNGDGLCYTSRDGNMEGTRVSTVEGNTLRCGPCKGLVPGTYIYRNYNRAFEKELAANPPKRLLHAVLDILVSDGGSITVTAACENGTSISKRFEGFPDRADNQELALKNILSQLGKTSGIFRFSTGRITGGSLPFIPLSALNGMRREIAGMLEQAAVEKYGRRAGTGPFRPAAPDAGHIIPPKEKFCLNCSNSLSASLYKSIGIEPEKAYELYPDPSMELMRTKYCLRNETGRCPGKGGTAEPLFLINNSRKMKVTFDCKACEMIISAYKGDLPGRRKPSLDSHWTQERKEQTQEP